MKDSDLVPMAPATVTLRRLRKLWEDEHTHSLGVDRGEGRSVKDPPGPPRKLSHSIEEILRTSTGAREERHRRLSVIRENKQIPFLPSCTGTCKYVVA